MPTLIRLIVVLLVLVGIAFGGMVALVATVSPRDKQVTIRIPARDLVPDTQRDPLVRREIDTTRPVAPVDTPAEVPAAPAEAPAAPAETPSTPADRGENQGDVVTLEPGTE
jgi:hypothetical protein